MDCPQVHKNAGRLYLRPSCHSGCLHATVLGASVTKSQGPWIWSGLCLCDLLKTSPSPSRCQSDTNAMPGPVERRQRLMMQEQRRNRQKFVDSWTRGKLREGWGLRRAQSFFKEERPKNRQAMIGASMGWPWSPWSPFAPVHPSG
jgi:hypothetical protein